MRFPKEEARFKKSSARFMATLEKAFPLGQRVVVKWGKGFSFGKVCGAPSATFHTIPILFDGSGRCHHKHFSDLEYA